MVEVFYIIMDFTKSLNKEYYYSLDEALNKEPHKKKLWESLLPSLSTLVEKMFDNYDITDIFIINEIFQKNNISEKISILIEIDDFDFDDIYDERYSLFENMNKINYYVSTSKGVYDINNNIEVDLSVDKKWKLKI